MAKALCVGINYPGTDHELAGCVNDMTDWSGFLRSIGFQITTLQDAQATKVNMVNGMRDVLHSLKDGETGVIQSSSHGTWVPDMDGDEPDGRDEAICPVDFSANTILIDDEIRQILQDRNPRSRIVLITDSCHSGTVFRFAGKPTGLIRPRFVPPAHFLKDPEILARAASLAYKPRGGATDEPIPGVIHFSACSDNEYASDAHFGSRGNGAFSYFMIQAVKARGAHATATSLFEGIREHLPSWDYRQTPRLNAAPELRNVPVFPV